MHRHRIALTTAACLVLATAGATTAASPTPGDSPAAPMGRIGYAFANPGTSAHAFTMAADGSDVIQLSELEADLVVWAPDGSRVAIPQHLGGDRWSTMVVGWDGSDPVTLPVQDGGLSLAPVAWSPDGTRIALEGWSESDPSLDGIYTADPALEDVELLLRRADGSAQVTPVAWSPDGTRLLFLEFPDDGDRGTLAVMAADGSDVIQLSSDGQGVWRSGFNVSGTWSPDSSSVAYTAFAGDGGRSAAYVVPATGGTPLQVSPEGMYATGARFSPDGTSVLFDKGPMMGGNHDLWLVAPDGGDPKVLRSAQEMPSGDCCGAWSPDGRWVAFQAGDASAATLWAIASDGSEVRPLATTPGEYVGYSWAPAAP
jgi:TolB protein